MPMARESTAFCLMKDTRYHCVLLLSLILFWIVPSVMADTVVDFENVPATSGTTFTSGGQTWSLTGNMATILSSNFGAPPVGQSTPESNGYIDTGVNNARSGNVGGIKAPTGFTFRAVSFDIWPSADMGGSVFEGGSGSAGTVGLSYQVIGKKNGNQVCSAVVADSLRNPPDSYPNNNGGLWHHLDLSGTLFASTDIDTVEFVLVAQTKPPVTSTADVMNYIAVDNFIYSNLLGPPASITPNPGVAGQSALVNQAFATSISVTVKDAGSNPVPNTNVTFTTPGTGASALFSNSTNTITVQTNASGVATAGVITANSTAGGPYNLSVTAGTASTNIPLTNTNLPTHFAVSAPAGTTAGTAFSATVTVLDQFNNTVPGYRGTVHFTTTDSGTGSSLPADYTFVAGDNGVHTFTNSMTLVTAGAQTLTATDTTNGSLTGTSNSIAVSPNVGTHLVVTTQPSVSATAGVPFATQPVVTLEDVYGNVVTTDSTHVVTASRGTGSGALQGASLTVTLANGVASFSGISYNVAETISLSFTSNAGAVPAANSGNVNVSAAGATHFLVSGPSPTTAGGAFNFTVAAKDPFNNTVTNYSGTVHFTSTDGQSVLPANAGLSNGAGTFSTTLKTAGSQTITATDVVNGAISGTSNAITVNSAAATHFVLNASSAATAGSAFTISVTAVDAFSNTATSYFGTVHFTTTDIGASTALPANYTFVAGDNGVHTFTNGVNLVTAGNQMVTGTDTVSGTITGTTSNIAISPNVANHMVVTTEPSTTATAGIPFAIQPVVTLEDAYGNVATTDSTHTVTVSRGTVGSGPLQGAALTVTLSNGVAAFTGLSYNIAEAMNLSFSSNAGSVSAATSNNITVNAAGTTHLVIAAPASATAGTAFNFTVTAKDQFNNTATGYAGTVHFTSTDGQSTLPANIPLSNGTGTFSSALRTAGSQTITGTDAGNGTITGTSGGIAVSSAAATHFALSASPTAVAGIPFNVSVTALDSFNNTASSYRGTVHFTTSDTNPGTAIPSNYTFVAGDNGIHTFTNGVTLMTTGGQTVTATDTLTSIAGSASVTVGDNVTVTAPVATAIPGGATGSFTFSRSGSVGAVTVNFQLDAASTAAASVFALSGGGVSFDTASGTGSVTIPGGSTSVTVTVTANANPTGEAQPGGTVKLDVATGTGYNIGTPGNAVVIISPSGFVVFNTNDSGAGSLRQAVLNANSLGGNPAITFDPSVVGTIALTSGELSVTQGMTLLGPATVSGNAQSRIFNISTSGTVTMARLTLMNGSGTSSGGAIHAQGNLTLTDCTISNNMTTGNGGGLAVSVSTLTMNRCTVSGNVCNNCSGLYLQDSTAFITNCTFSGNSGVTGDAIRLNAANRSTFTTLQNCTISGNSTSNSGDFGSALTLEAPAAPSVASATLTNCTVSGNINSAASGKGAIHAAPGASQTILFLQSTIVSGNLAGGSPSDITGVVALGTSSANLIGVGGGLTNGTNGNIVGVNNPLLGPLANNGGPTLTMLPLAGSLAVDGGRAANAAPEVTVSGSTGTYTLTYNGATTSALSFNASLAVVKAALTNLSTIGGVGGVVTLIGSPSDYVVIFGSNLAGNAFPLTANGNGGATVQVATYDQRGPGFPRVRGVSVDIGAVEAQLFTPTVTNATTNEDTPTTSGLVITANPADGGATTNYQITNINGGFLYLSDATTVINNGDFITVAQGAAGLIFSPGANLNSFASSFGFNVQAAVGTTASDLRDSVVSAAITVNPVADTPSVTSASTTPNTQTASGLVVSRNAVDGAETAFFKITNIVSGTLYLNDGVTPVGSGSFITAAQGNAGLKFTPSTGFIGAASFDVQGSNDSSGTGLSSIATAAITVATVNPTTLQIGTTGTLDRQTGLFDLDVNVTNTTAAAINGFRLHVDYSSYVKSYPSLKLQNATSLANYPDVYVDYPYPVAVGATVVMHLEFYTSNRQFPNPFAPALTVTTLSSAQTPLPNPQGIQVRRIVRLADGTILLEFPTTPHLWYRIQFSNDLVHWYDSQVPIQASATQTQWIDNGAPLTNAPPSTVPSRFYYVRQIATP